jgi:hypothetical protein
VPHVSLPRHQPRYSISWTLRLQKDDIIRVFATSSGDNECMVRSKMPLRYKSAPPTSVTQLPLIEALPSSTPPRNRCACREGQLQLKICHVQHRLRPRLIPVPRIGDLAWTRCDAHLQCGRRQSFYSPCD